jgi:argininosuccinate synthase
VLSLAHEELEGLIFDRELLHAKRVLAERYSELVYYGLWFSPLKEALDAFFARHQRLVTGDVRFRFQKGHATAVGRRSPHSAYSEELATYSEKDAFDHSAANGFIKLWGLPYEGRVKQR